jgi:hypothetical protein
MASGNVQNFTTNRFVLDTSGFSNRFNGVFGIASPGGSSLAITYTPPVLVPIVITTRTIIPGGSFQMTFAGPPGQPFRVLGTNTLSAPLSTWPALSQGVIGSTGSALFTDPAASSDQSRFYRIVSP